MLEIIAIACIGVLWTQSEPTNYYRHRLYNFIWPNKDLDGMWHWRLINCCMCSTFYIALIITQSIYVAAISSVLGELLCKKLTSGSL